MKECFIIWLIKFLRCDTAKICKEKKIAKSSKGD